MRGAGGRRQADFADETKDDKIDLFGGLYTIGVALPPSVLCRHRVGASLFINNVDRFAISDALTTLNTPFQQAGGYAYLGGFNAGSGPTYPRAGNDLGIGWNFGSNRDIGIWNTDTSSTLSFIFRQLKPGNTRADLLYLYANGALVNYCTAASGPVLQVYNPNFTTTIFAVDADSSLWFNTTGVGFSGSGMQVWGSAPTAARSKLLIRTSSGAVFGYIPIYN